jgi:ABC-type branched-subunit amino acid transport system ATPase component
MRPILTLENIYAGYGNLTVLKDISLDIDRGEKILIIGPNGCGKTTLLQIVSGVLKLQRGKVILKENDITSHSAVDRTSYGLGYLMQTRNIFPSLTVEENFHISCWQNDKRYNDRSEWLLNIFPMLKEKFRFRAGFLSGGERQALAICIVLMRPVDLLLLDEPTAGLSPKAACMILEALQKAQEEDLFTCVTVEHNLRLIYKWVSRVLVMNQGTIVANEKNPFSLLNPENLQKYYFS